MIEQAISRFTDNSCQIRFAERAAIDSKSVPLGTDRDHPVIRLDIGVLATCQWTDRGRDPPAADANPAA